MTPIAFSRRYRFDPRIVDGSYFSGAPLALEPGDVVGVVLLNLGGPRRRDDVEPFLYNLFMDPAIIDIPLKGVTRHLLCRLISSLRAKKVAADYARIDPEGGSPINRLTEAQAAALERALQEGFGAPNDVIFKAFIAMRYWHPFSEEADAAMREAGVTKVILLPLYPHYSKTTTGASLVYWKALEESGEIPSRPTTYVKEYAAHPRYLRALSDRIDEGLARFPEAIRPTARLLFSAHGTPVKEMTERNDPYCCLIHSTVDRLMKERAESRPFSVSFQSKVGPAEWLKPSTVETVTALGAKGEKALLVIPVAFVTDHIETAFELDVEVREIAHHAGIEEYGVTGGLNDHPEFIAALAETAAAQLTIGGRSLTAGVPAWPERPLFAAGDRGLRCAACRHVTEARVWPSAPARNDPARST